MNIGNYTGIKRADLFKKLLCLQAFFPCLTQPLLDSLLFNTIISHTSSATLKVGFVHNYSNSRFKRAKNVVFAIRKNAHLCGLIRVKVAYMFIW